MAGDPHLSIQRRERSLDVDDHALDLDHHDETARPMKRKQINAATFAVMVERDLGIDLPAMRLEPALPVFLEAGMIGIEEATEVAVRHVNRHPKITAGSGDRRAKRAERMPIEPPRLELGDERPRHRSGSGQVGLAPALAVAEGTNDATDEMVVHG